MSMYFYVNLATQLLKELSQPFRRQDGQSTSIIIVFDTTNVVFKTTMLHVFATNQSGKTSDRKCYFYYNCYTSIILKHILADNHLKRLCLDQTNCCSFKFSTNVTVTTPIPRLWAHKNPTEILSHYTNEMKCVCLIFNIILF